MNEYGKVGPWIFLYIQYSISFLGWASTCIMQQRETEKYLMGLVSRRTLLYLQYVYRSRIHEHTIVALPETFPLL
jgi:hypothetical protein